MKIKKKIKLKTTIISDDKYEIHTVNIKSSSTNKLIHTH